MSCVRVAVASRDGVDVDQPLQEASVFRIYDVEPDRHRFLETRKGRPPFEEPGRPTRAGLLLERISDCSLLLVREIGGGTGGTLRIGWVTAYEAPMPVEKALRKLSGNPVVRRALGRIAEEQIMIGGQEE